MTTTETAPPTTLLTRTAYLVYGVTAYVAFLVVFLWAIAFVENASIVIGGVEIVPRTIDRGGPSGGIVVAVVIDLGLLALFAAQHSVMARDGFKRRWTRLVPQPIERSTYVLAATACLAVLLWWWHPITATVWDASAPALRWALVAASLSGWILVLIDVPHQPLRSVRSTSGGRQRASATAPALPVRHAPLVRDRSPPDLSRVRHRFLGGPDDDRPTSGV